MTYFSEPKNVQELNKLTDKILLSESPGMRQAKLVDACHVVDGNDVVSFVVYDKDPVRQEDGQMQHERRWVVVITLQDQPLDTASWSKTRGIVSVRWDEGEDDGRV